MTPSVTRRATFAALARGDRARHGAVRLRFIDADHPDMQPETSVALAFAFPASFGNAVERNRVKRRLRAAFDDAGGPKGRGAVLISAQRSALDAPYERLVSDLRTCLRSIGQN